MGIKQVRFQALLPCSEPYGSRSTGRVMPRSRRYGDDTVTYICRSEIPSRIYANLSTGKNQSSKIRGALYILTYEYNYKVIIRYDIILQEYYITDRRKYEYTKRYIIMINTKDAHES